MKTEQESFADILAILGQLMDVLNQHPTPFKASFTRGEGDGLNLSVDWKPPREAAAAKEAS